MSDSIDKVCTRYLDAWSRKDLGGIAACLHTEVDFKSPNAHTQGREAFLSATKRFFPLVQKLDVHARFVSSDQAMFAYDFVCIPPVGICPTAELLTFQDGLIRVSQIYFDARPFEALQRAASPPANK